MAAGLALCKGPRKRLPVGASALGFLVLYWLYIFPIYRLPDEKAIVPEVLRQQGRAWRRNLSARAEFRKLLKDCCDPSHLFAMTKENSPVGKSIWYDGEFLYYFTIDDKTFSLFPKAIPFQLPLKRCSVVGNSGILKKSCCGKQIDQADFVMRCNLPPLSNSYKDDVGSKTQLVTANPSIIKKRFQNLLWSRKAFVDSVKVYNQSYIYMPAFSMKTGTEPSLRVYYTLTDVEASQSVIFANPNFLRDIGKFWKSKGIHGKRLSTGLFLVSVALGLCEEVTIYGFWPFSVDLHGQYISHHYYDNVLPDSGFHAMPEEFLQLWFLHKRGTHWLAEILTHIYASKVALTSPIEFGDLSVLDQLNRLSCKRIIPTHLDGNMLPPTFRIKHCKAIYIVRNPKDIAVSMFHYYQENPNLPTVDSWPNFLEMFLKGDVVCGSWFDHVLSWEKHLPEKNILFLFYEDMKKDLPQVVKKLSAFLGLNPSESKIYEVCKMSSFNQMKTNTEKENLDQNHTVCVLTSNRKLIFRKGNLKSEPNGILPRRAV